MQIRNIPKSNKKMEEVARKPITAELRNLKKGEAAVFPMEQRASVVAIVNRLRKELMRKRWQCEVEDNDKDFQVIVTRL